MKRVLRSILVLILVLVAIAVVGLGYVYVASSRLMAKSYTVPALPAVRVRTESMDLERGKYLVERVAACVQCHGTDLGGQVVDNSFAMGQLVAANLTRGRGGVGATMSDEDFVRSIVHGVKRDGHSVVFMPSSDYHFSEADLGAIIGYIRSVPPVDRELPRTAVGPMARALGLFTDFPLTPAARIDHANVRLAAPLASTDAAQSGEYLIASAGCRGCHGPEFKGGGGPPPGAANITPVGIGDWTDDQFITALREHKRPNGTTIEEVMPRQFGQMSDDDLRAIRTFLRRVAPSGEKSANQKKTS